MIEGILGLVFGLLIGSFLNVCIHRWPRGRSVVKPRSHCVRCRKMIPWYDNIPLVSYAVLRGRCRYCRRPISPRYPTVELLTGLLFFFFFATLPPLYAAKMAVFSAILVGLIFSDMEKRLLPDELTLGGTLLGFIFSVFVPVPDTTAQALLWLFGMSRTGRPLWIASSLFGAFLPAIVLWGGGWLYEKLRHREGLGFGDVKLIAMVGSFLGLQNALLALFLGSISGSLLGSIYIKITHKDWSTYQLPFGSFIGAGALAAAMAGQKILGWYSGL